MPHFLIIHFSFISESPNTGHERKDILSVFITDYPTPNLDTHLVIGILFGKFSSFKHKLTIYPAPFTYYYHLN